MNSGLLPRKTVMTPSVDRTPMGIAVLVAFETFLDVVEALVARGG